MLFVAIAVSSFRASPRSDAKNVLHFIVQDTVEPSRQSIARCLPNLHGRKGERRHAHWGSRLLVRRCVPPFVQMSKVSRHPVLCVIF